MKRLLLIFLVLMSTVCALAQQPAKELDLGGDLGFWVGRLKRFSQKNVQEKIFVHMDNTSYCVGDTIWYSVYMRAPFTGKGQRQSEVAYVELLSPDGYMLERQIVDIYKGFGFGQIAIKSEYLYAGFYELRAYTRWQLNWGRYEHPHSHDASTWFRSEEKEKEYYRDYEKLYSRVFPVYDKPRTPGIYDHSMSMRPMRRTMVLKDKPTKVTLKLFPEGGNLVEGQSARVAFEACYDNGEWAEGTLSCGDVKAETENRGRGTFVVTPGAEPMDATFTAITGETVTMPLPKTVKDAVSLCVEKKGTAWTATVGTNKDRELGVTVMAEGMVQKAFCIDKLHNVISVEEADLPAGVNQITIFDVDGRVMADRLFFNTSDELYGTSFTFEGLQKRYKPYEKVSFSVKKAVERKGMVSLAVRDGSEYDSIYDSGNIMTEMLLASEIRGFVPSPGWYFAKNDERHHRALELLMMTQGWRRYNWQEMTEPGLWKEIEPMESTPIMRGRVLDPVDTIGSVQRSISDIMGGGVRKNESLVHTEIIPIDGSTPKVKEMTTEKRGRFQLTLPRMYEKAVLFFSAIDERHLNADGKFRWIIQTRDDEDGPLKMKQNYQVYSAVEKLLDVLMDNPYPMFTKPYDFYQKQVVDELADYDEEEAVASSRGRTNMKQVKVSAKRERRSILRAFADTIPTVIVDAYAAYNNILDAGFVNKDYFAISRYYVSDMGLYTPFLQVDGGRDYRVRVRFGMSNDPHEYMEKKINMSRNDSVGITSKKETEAEKIRRESMTMGLRSQSGEENFEEQKLMKKHNDLKKLERFVVYTDYCPRREFDGFYTTEDLPEVVIVPYAYPDESRRVVYFNRRYVWDGYAQPLEYYTPDYSKQPLPEGGDYRRTLYWNPRLKFDEEGRAEVQFYNNAHDSRLNISVNGMTEKGALLY